MALSKAQMWEIVEGVTPIWMFRCRPADFCDDTTNGHWVCPGLLWLPSLITLFSLHVVCFGAFTTLWFRAGYTPKLLVCLAPVALLWLLFGSADIKFRLQRPTRTQRTFFDNAAINWFGMIVFVPGFCIGMPFLILHLLGRLWQWLAPLWPRFV